MGRSGGGGGGGGGGETGGGSFYEAYLQSLPLPEDMLGLFFLHKRQNHVIL